MEYINKNILEAFREGEFNVLLHQTNCSTGNRVIGIAKDIFDEYPWALEAHLNYCVFGHISFRTKEDKSIVNLNSQYYGGRCNNTEFYLNSAFSHIDNFNNRIAALELCLLQVRNLFGDSTIGIPLLASGIGADIFRKGSLTDLEYFKEYIAPVVEGVLPNIKVYYL